MSIRKRSFGLVSALAVAIGLVWLWKWSSDADASAERLRAGENTRYTTVNDRVAYLDPVRTFGPGQGAFAIAQNIYESLYQYHYLRRPFVVVPCLAKELPVISEDGKSCTIALRDDVYFQDDPCFQGGKGRKLEAEDVIYSWKRLADPHNASPYWDLLRGRIRGLDEFRKLAKDRKRGEVSYDGDIEGLSAQDKATLKISFERSWPQMLYALTALPTGIVPREAVEHYGEEFSRHPVGTGPYMLENWAPGSEIVLRRNHAFREELYPAAGEPGDEEKGLLRDAGARIPFIDRLNFRLVEVGQPTWMLLMQGALDLHGVPGSNYSQIITLDGTLTEDKKSRGLVLEVFMSTFSRWIALNMGDPLISGNLPLRQALSLAMNRKEFNDTVLNGRSRLPTGLIPDIYEEHLDRKCHPAITYDLDRARAMKEKADALNGKPIANLRMLMAGNSPLLRQIGQMFQRWMEQIGIRLELEIVDEANVQRRMQERPPHMMFGAGFGAQSPDVSQLFLRFYGPNIESGLNPFNYRNTEFDARYERALEILDPKERIRAYRELEEKVLDEGFCIVLLDYTWQTARFGWLKNYKPLTFSGPAGCAKYQRLDREARVRYVDQREP